MRQTNFTKPAKQKKGEMKICDECGTPLIWTFFWAYNEYFCINCDYHWGMMGAGEWGEATPERKKKLRKLRKLWKTMCRYMIPRSAYTFSRCKKCREGARNHREHLTAKEKRQDKIMTKVLVAMKGVFV